MSPAQPNSAMKQTPAVAVGDRLCGAVPLLHLALRATGKEYCLTQLTMAAYYAIVVTGLGLLMGYAGQVSLGHGAFFALGGYTTAALTTHDFSRWQTQLAGRREAHLMAVRQDLYGSAILTRHALGGVFCRDGGGVGAAC